MTSLTISQLAKAAQVNITTIRYYERCGLLEKPQRSFAGYRLYSENEIFRIRFITQAKELGFSLEEIAELLVLQTNPQIPCAAVKACTAEKIRSVDEKIQALQKIKQALQALHDRCHSEDPISECPILGSLNNQYDRETQNANESA